MTFKFLSPFALSIALSIILAVALALPASAAPAQTPTALCAQHGTDDTLRPVPEPLAGAVNQAFGTAMPAAMVAATTVYRCAGGRVELCTTGANLPCGKADTSRTPGAGAVSWCRATPDASFIPAYVTGHDTVYEWRCRHGAPQIVRQSLAVDQRGFIAPFWKPLP